MIMLSSASMLVGPRYGLLLRLYRSSPSLQFLADPRTLPKYEP